MKININIPPILNQMIEDKVKGGNYKDKDDVIADALRVLAEKDKAVDALGFFNGADFESMAFLVLMQAARDAEDELKEIMNEMKARNAAKRILREFTSKVRCDIANSTGQARPKFSPSGIGSERAYHHVLLPVPDPCAENGVRLIETDLHEGRITEVSILESIYDDLKGKLDSLSEMGEMESLRLQMTMDRRSKFISTLSNIMKRMSDTSQSIIQNMK